MAGFDSEELLDEISAQAPCGENLEYDPYFMALIKKAEIIPESQKGDCLEAEQHPNWKEVRKDLLDLMKRTRDLRLLVEMARACLNIEGATGLHESLELLRRSLEAYWETIHPQLDPEDDNDPTLRLNILLDLCNPKSYMLRFVQDLVLVESKILGRYSLKDIGLASGKLAAPPDTEVADLSKIKAAFAEVSENNPDKLLETHAQLVSCIESIEKIESFVTDKVAPLGFAGLSLKALRDRLKEALHAMQENMAYNGLFLEAESVAASIDDSAKPLQSSQPKAALADNINSRQDVIRALDLICEYYARCESSSPVPLLAQRAKRLVNMNFMEIIEDLASDGLSQIKMIKGKDPDGNE